MKKILIILSIIFGIVLTIILASLTYLKTQISKTDEILKKTIQAHQNVKSLTINSTIEENNQSIKSKITVNLEPLFVNVTGENNDGTSYETYFDNSFEYNSDNYPTNSKPKTLIWEKEKINDEEKNTILNYIVPKESLEYANLYKLTETDSTYKLESEDNSGAHKHTLIIDKNTHLLKSDESIQSEKKVKLEYSNYNSEIDTKIPEEATKAKEE